MKEITNDFAELTANYIKFAKEKVKEASEGVSKLSALEVEDVVRTANMLVVTLGRLQNNQLI